MKYLTVAPTFRNIWDDLDTLTDGFFGTTRLLAYSPKVDVAERPDAYSVEVELPGYSDKDVDVKVKDGLLTISSVKTAEKDSAGNGRDEGVKYLIRERSTSGFSRSFKLPRDVEADRIEAAFKNGILSLTLPRKEETQPKSITIRTE